MKKSWFMLLGILLAMLNCKTEVCNPPNIEKPAVASVDPPENLCDDYLWESDTIFQVSAGNFQDEQLNGVEVSKKFQCGNKFAGCIVSGLSDGFVGVFISDSLGQNWTPCYCGSIEIGSEYEILLPDLNFDGYRDILVDGHDGGVYGNCFSTAFLYNPENLTFQRYPSLDLPNLSVDTKHKRLRSRHYSSVCGGSGKWLYKWEHDSLLLLGEAVFQGCLGDDLGTIDWTMYRDGKTISDSRCIDSEKAWAKFEHLLWNGFDREKE